jgi:ankyrin repeat protein
MNNRGTEDRFISFDEVQRTLIELLLSKNVESNLVNKKNHSPIDLCVENGNIVGMKLLLTLKVSLNFESTSGMTILHYLSKIASKDRAGMEFVIERLCQLDKNSLKESLKKIDINGFEAILYFVRDFTYEVIKNYTSMVLTLTAQLANGDG